MKPQTLADAGKKKGSIAGSVQSREYILIAEKRKAEQEIRIA